ncbi:MAG: hypothetical protein ACYC64_06960 [Armatimonadota bacterium]
MKRSARYVLVIAMVLVAASCAHGLARFQDDFSLPDGQPDSKWDVVSGSYLVQSGKFVPGLTHGATDLVLAREAVGRLLMDKYTMSFWAGSPSGIADNFGVYVHWKDADNFVRLWFANNQAYWQTKIAGTWNGPFFAMSVTDLNRSNLIVQVRVQPDGAYGEVGDGMTSHQTYLPVAYYASVNGIATAIGLEANEWAGGTRFDDVTIDDPLGVTIGVAKAAGPGWYGRVRGYVTAVFNDYSKFVVESEDRSSAITVAPLTESLQIGQEVIVLGTIQDDGTFMQEGCTITGNQKILDSLGVKNHDIAGADSSPGPSNMDILVKSWGKVLGTPAPFVTPGYGLTTFYITDGSASGKSTAQVLGAWSLEFQDNFNSGRNALWGDYGVKPQVQSGVLQYNDGNCISWVSQRHAVDEIVTADVVQGTTGQIGLVCRFVNTYHFLVAVWLQDQKRLYFHEVKSGNWGDPLGNVYYDVPLNLPAHMTAEVRGMTAKLTVSDGTRFYSTSTTLTRWPDPQLAGIFHDFTANGIDNFKLCAASAPMTIDADVVQVTVPGSVTGAITVNPGDYVKVTGIVSNGSTLAGAVRGLTIREAEDLSKEQ